MIQIKKRWIILLLGILLLAALVSAGCGKDQATPAKPDTGSEQKETVTLYFSDSQAMYLVPEKRQVTRTNEPLEEIIVKELIKGPAEKGHLPTIPAETKLLSVSVVDGVAYLDFSKELQTKHWGGSTGEMMTIGSVTNSLDGVNGIKKVQFLVEGKKLETILGHAYTAEPIGPNWDLVKK